MKTRILFLATAMLGTALAAGHALQQKHDRGLVFLPKSWVDEVTNPYFPLHPGTRFHYEGETDGTPTSDDMVVTHRTRTILGVVCTVVNDKGYTKKRLTEETDDYYAQDADGNVWYFGEDTRELDKHGDVISTEGTWLSGVNGASPGIIMLAHPQVGDAYEQEHAAGVAEDHARVISLDETVTVPFGTFDQALFTQEWSPLEPGVLSGKYYVQGIGDVLEVSIQGANETLQLVSVTSDG